MARLLLPPLLPGTDYYVQLRSVAEDTVSEWSRRFTITTDHDDTPPDVPTWAVSNPWVVQSDAFIATWNALLTDPNDPGTQPQNLDFDHYELNLTDDVTNVTIRTNNTSYTLTYDQNRVFFQNNHSGFAAATVKVKIRTVDKVGNFSAWTTPILAATNPVPSNVTNLVTTSLVDGIKCSWDAVAGTTDDDIVGYRVSVSTTAGGASGYNSVYQALGTNFTYSTTQYLTDHYIRVVAVDKFGSVSASPIQSAAIRPKSSALIETLAPKTPTFTTLATIVNNGTGLGAKASLAWTAVTQNSDNSTITDLAGYRVQYRKVGTTPYNQIDFSSDATTGTVELQDAYSNYEFQIRAFDWQNNLSAWSTTYTATSPGAGTPGIPGSFVGVAEAGGLRYSWTATSDTNLKQYEVLIATNVGFTTGLQTFVVGPNTLNLVINALPTATAYWAKVRAVNVAGTAGTYSSIDNRSTLTYTSQVVITADVIQSGTLGAAINVGAGSSLVLNGGFLRSNTYNGSYVVTGGTTPGTYYAAVPLSNGTTVNGGTVGSSTAPSAGFYLGNDGLVIKQGVVNAATLETGNISTAALNLTGTGEIKSGGYVDGTSTTGFRLSSTGLQIPNGSITAAKLLIQNSANVLPAQFAGFEFGLPDIFGGAAVAADTVNAMFGSTRSVTMSGPVASGGTQRGINLRGPLDTDYNVPIQPSKTYTVSAYVKNNIATANALKIGMRGNDGNYAVGTNISGGVTNVTTNWTRIFATFVMPATVTAAWFYIYNDNNLAFNINVDAVQVEQQTSGDINPGPWSAPGATSIDGGMIKTGSIQSSDPGLTLAGTTLPWWSIDMSGSAQFGNLTVRGDAVVGSNAAESTVGSPLSSLRSYTYTQGQSGWAIFADGSAEFRSVVIDGGGVVPGTLGADAIKTGTLLAADVTVTGSLNSQGLMGENIALDGDGFHVLSAFELNLTAVQISSGVLTGNTTLNPMFTVGKKLVITGTGTLADGVYSVASTGTNSFTCATSKADITSVATPDATVKSWSDNSLVTRQTLIDFPSNGEDPNIISGNLTADTLVITTGASFRGVSNIETAGQLVLQSTIIAPKSSPTIAQHYYDLPFTGTKGTPYGFTKGHNGNYFLLSAYTTYFSLDEYSATTGAFIASRANFSNSYTFPLGNPLHPTGTQTTTVSPRGLVYYNNVYYVLTHSVYKSTPTGGSTTTTYGNDYAVLDTSYGNYNGLVAANIDTTNSNVALGFDYTRNLLMYVAWASNVLTVKYITPTTTTFNSIVSGGTIPTINTALTDPASIMRISDMDGLTGTDRFYIRNRAYGTVASTQQWCVFTVASNAASSQAAGEQWPAGYSSYTYGAYYDTTAKSIQAFSSSGFAKLNYQGADSWWNSTTMTSQRWIGYSWYDSSTSTGGGATAFTHETDLSPRASVALNKRAGMKFTIGAIPYIGTNDSPNQARMYIAATAAEPSLAGNPVDTNWKLRVTVDYPNKTGFIVPTNSPTNTQPPNNTGNPATGGNSFLSLGSATPGLITSADGGSYWKATNEAKFNKLILTSTTDVTNTTTADADRGALIIGDTAGSHLRFDDNEIISMTNGSTQGSLNLNLGGSVAMAGQTITRWKWGSATIPNAAAITSSVTFAHGMGGAPTAVIAVPTSGTGVSQVFLNTAADATNITIACRRYNDTNLVGAIGVDYIAFR